jgi:hypothetical protein
MSDRIGLLLPVRGSPNGHGVSRPECLRRKSPACSHVPDTVGRSVSSSPERLLRREGDRWYELRPDLPVVRLLDLSGR